MPSVPPSIARTPATFGLIGVVILGFFTLWLSSGSEAALSAVMQLSLVSGWPLSRPWSVITYWVLQPVGGFGLLMTLLLSFWLYQIGRFMEPSLGSWRLVQLWLLLAVVGGLSLAVGMRVLTFSPLILGFSVPLAALTLVWAARNRGAEVRLFGVLPLKAPVLGIAFAAIVAVGVGTGAPLLALFCAVPFVLGWLIGVGTVPLFQPQSVLAAKPTKAEIERQRAFEEEVARRKQERYEQEKLRALFERSADVEDPEERRDS